MTPRTVHHGYLRGTLLPGGVCCALALLLWALPLHAGGIFDGNWTPPRRTASTRPAVTPAPSTPAETQPARREVPARLAQARSRDNLNLVFAEQLKDQTPGGRRKLAALLFDTVAKTADNPVDQYVLLGGTINAAREGANLRLCIEAADELSRMFDVDGLALKTDAALNMNLRGATTADTADNVRVAMGLLDPLVAEGELPAATRLCERIEPLTFSDPSFPPLVARRSKEIGAFRAIYDRYGPALAKLKTAPDDAPANLAVGEYDCFVRGAWNDGIPYLAKGSDLDLKKAATGELSGAKTADEHKLVGDGWWAAGDKQAEPMRGKVREHAAVSYEQALTGTTGLGRELIEKRLAELAAEGATPSANRPRLAAPDSQRTDALVLFDGKDASRWQPQWPVVDGAMVSEKKDCFTKQEFTDFKLHLEFNEPRLGPKFKSQARGNSGVFLQGRYELQILDSYQNETYPKGGCGSIYGIADPLKNVARPPGEWQTYDITFHAARFKHGVKSENARVTVYWNGELVQDNTEITGSTAGQAKEADGPGPIGLQYHGNAVRFRNIRIVPLQPGGVERK